MVETKIPVKLIYRDMSITLNLTKSFIKSMCIQYTCNEKKDTNSFEFISITDFFRCIDSVEQI